MKSSRAFFAAAFGGILWLASASQAYAYLDPGTGSFVLQILIGGVAGGLMVMKLYWVRVRSYMLGFLPQRGGSEAYNKKAK